MTWVGDYPLLHHLFLTKVDKALRQVATALYPTVFDWNERNSRTRCKVGFIGLTELSLQNLTHAETCVWYCLRVSDRHDSKMVFKGSPVMLWVIKDDLTQDIHEVEVWGTEGELPLVDEAMLESSCASWLLLEEISWTEADVDSRTALANVGKLRWLLFCFLGQIEGLCRWD